MLFRPGLVGRLPCPQDWYFSSGVPSIDDPFTGAVLPAGWVFNRASANATNSTYMDGNAVTTYTTYGVDQPRLLPFGLLMEPARTNYFLNSEVPTAGTKTITLPVGTYTCWYLGGGAFNVAISGTTAVITEGSLFVDIGKPATFHVTTPGTISVVISTTCLRVQIENGADATSYILTTVASVTRAEDRLYKNYLAGQLNATQGTYWVEFMWNGTNYPDISKAQTSAKLMTAGLGSYASNNNTDMIEMQYVPGSNFILATTNVPGVQAQGNMSPIPRPIGGVDRLAVSVASNKNMVAMDYVLGSMGVNTNGIRPATLMAITLGGGGAAASTFNGFIRGFRYWPVAMPDSELKECTGAGYYNGPPVFDLDGTNQNHWRRWTLQITAAPTGVATDALMTDAPGTPYTQYPAANTSIRSGPRGILLDFNRVNGIPNSFAPAASGTTASLGVGTYYIASMRGTGSMTISNGTGVSASMPFTLTQGMAVSFLVTTTGNFTWTSTGQLELAMIENIGGSAPSLGFNAQATTFLRTTTAGQLRGAQGLSLPVGSWGQTTSFTVVIDMLPFIYTNSGMIIDVGDGTNTNTERLYLTYANNTIVTNQVNTSNNVSQGGITGTAPPPLNVLHKYAYNVQAGAKRQMAGDGVMLPPGNIGITRAINISTMRLGISNNVFFPWNCFIKRLRYYDYAITDDALAALTVVTESTLDINFMSSQLDPRITWTRTTTATDGTYLDAAGSSYNVLPINTPRIDATRGLLVENTVGNYLLNSNTPATQTTVSLGAAGYCLWVIGTGSATVAAGTAVGTGWGTATAGNPIIISTTGAGTMVVTVSGTLTRFQLESRPYPTSYIPTTGVGATRQVDAGMLLNGTWNNPVEGTLAIDFVKTHDPKGAFCDLPGLWTDVNNTTFARLIGSSSLQATTWVGGPLTGATGTQAATFGPVNKSVFTYSTITTEFRSALNGVIAAKTNPSAFPTTAGIHFGITRSGALDGRIRRLQYWPRAVSDAELVSIST